MIIFYSFLLFFFVFDKKLLQLAILFYLIKPFLYCVLDSLQLQKFNFCFSVPGLPLGETRWLLRSGCMRSVTAKVGMSQCGMATRRSWSTTSHFVWVILRKTRCFTGLLCFVCIRFEFLYVGCLVIGKNLSFTTSTNLFCDEILICLLNIAYKGRERKVWRIIKYET